MPAFFAWAFFVALKQRKNKNLLNFSKNCRVQGQSPARSPQRAKSLFVQEHLEVNWGDEGAPRGGICDKNSPFLLLKRRRGSEAEENVRSSAKVKNQHHKFP